MAKVPYNKFCTLKKCKKLATLMGLEPMTSAVTGRRSNQLSYKAKQNWWTFTDLNRGPTGYEPAALTNWAKGPSVPKGTSLVGVKRLELPAPWSQTTCATNCATPRSEPYFVDLFMIVYFEKFVNSFFKFCYTFFNKSLF